jgi:Flp pilus assembly CpaF family ATPase
MCAGKYLICIRICGGLQVNQISIELVWVRMKIEARIRMRDRVQRFLRSRGDRSLVMECRGHQDAVAPDGEATC